MKKSLILSKYHLASLWNWRSVYLSRLVEPLAYFIFLVGGIAGMLGDTAASNYAYYAFTGIICFLAFRIFPYTVGDISNDRKWGVYAIFMMQGGKTSTYLLSIVAVATLVFLVQLALLTLVYYLFAQQGAAADFTTVMLAAFTGVLVVCGWAGVGATVGALVDSYSTRDMISTLTSLPIVLSAPLFYQLESAPAYLQVIAHANPLTYHAAWVRNPDALNLGYAALWATACSVAAIFALKRADHLSRER